MGKGYDFHCKKCGKNYAVFLGVGFCFATASRNEIEAIANGEFGPELKEAYEQTPYAVIDPDNVVFICRKCGCWIVDTDHTLYAPKDPDAIAKRQFGEKTAEEWGCVPYVIGKTLREDYRVLKRHYHKCDRCGSRMHKATDKEVRSLPCPECGEINEENGYGILWD